MPKPHEQRLVHSSENPNWRTPPLLVDQLKHEDPAILIDAAADYASRVCEYYFGPDHPELSNALLIDWLVYTQAFDEPAHFFLNPPYSRKVAAALKKQGDPRADAYRIENWAKKCWTESRKGCTIYGLFPHTPQVGWWRRYVEGHDENVNWSGHAAREVRRLPFRLKFYLPDGTETEDTAGVSHAIIVWDPALGITGPWQPQNRYWRYLGYL